MNIVPVAIAAGAGVYLLTKQQGPVPVAVPPYNYSYDPALDPNGQAAFNIDGRYTDPDAQQKVDLLGSAMQKAYDGMNGAAKSVAADQLNKSLNLDPPLKGNETWDTVARVAGGVAGAAACNAIPGIGTAASPLCAMAGAYLGVKLEQWMGTNLGDLGSWVKDNLGDVVNTIGDKISDWFHDIF